MSSAALRYTLYGLIAPDAGCNGRSKESIYLEVPNASAQEQGTIVRRLRQRNVPIVLISKAGGLARRGGKLIDEGDWASRFRDSATLRLAARFRGCWLNVESRTQSIGPSQK